MAVATAIAGGAFLILAGVLAVAAANGDTNKIKGVDWNKLKWDLKGTTDVIKNNWEESKKDLLNPIPESITIDNSELNNSTSEKKDTAKEPEIDMPLTDEIAKENGINTGGNKDEEPKGNRIPIIAPSTEGTDEIQDKTNDGLEVNISNSTWDDWKNYLEENRKYQDELRKHYEEREDTAVERWIASARRAGVNVNLLSSIGEAASGGGISNMMDSSNEQLLEQMQLKSEELLKMLEIKFQGDKAGFEGAIDLIQSLGMIAAMMGYKKGG